MDFEEILANCLDALERGETIESCLARYPQNATELASLLRLATTVRSTPQPRLSAEAFQRGRDAVRAQAQHHHSLHAPFVAAPTKTSQKAVVQHAQPTTPILPPREPHKRKPLNLLYRTTGAFSALVLLLCLLTLMRNIISSLPGTTLYPIKILSENMEGVLLTAAGEQVTWHAQQTENRLQELVMLTQQQQAATDALVQNIDAHVQATLAASNRLPAAQRNQFLLAWIERLQTIQKAKNLSPTVALTLENALATVKSATQVTLAPATTPAARTPTARPFAPSTPILVPTAIPSAAPAAMVQQAPAEVTANHPERTPIEVTPVPLPTHALEEPVVIAPTPTAAQVVIQMPKENPSSGEDSNHQSRHTAKSPVDKSPVEPTADPIIAAAATQTANSAAANATSANLATSNSAATQASDVKASRAMTTSVDSAPDTAASSNKDNSGSASNQSTATAALAAPPDLASTATGAVVTSPEGADTPEPLASTTSSANNSGDGKNTGTATPTPEATASATKTAKRTPTPQKTATPEKAAEPTDRPTDLPEPMVTSADDEPTQDAATSKPTAEATTTPNSDNHKQPNKK